MFRFCRDKRIIAFGLIFMGLGIILLIPKLSEASNQAPLYAITDTSIDFYCTDCLPIQEQMAPHMVQVVVAPVASNPCDICHTDPIDTLEEDVQRANKLEAELDSASINAIVLQGKDYSEFQLGQIEQAVHLLEQVQTELDAGNLDSAATLLNQANNIMADVQDAEMMDNAWSSLFVPFALLNSSSTSKYNGVAQVNHLASYLLAKDTSLSSILVFENSFSSTYNPTAMHRRAPPADEDALIFVKAYPFWHGRLSHFSAQSPFYLPVDGLQHTVKTIYSFVKVAVVTVQPQFLGII